MAVYSSDLTGILPEQTLDGIIEGTKTRSTIIALSDQDPMKFGKVNLVTFDEDPAAEFVEEGGKKSSEDIKPGTAQAVPHKAVVTYRTSDEFMWANEDYQLGILDKFAEKAARALGRALDLGAYFRVNPKTGNEIGTWTNYVNATTNRVEIAADSDSELIVETAVGLLVPNGISATGIALSPQLAWDLATVRYSDGRKKYPELGYTITPTAFEGLSASTSTTVTGKARDKDTTDNGVRAIVGDFNEGLRWGIQREVPFQVIPYGDPDNTGRDLKGHNEVALRAEVVYAWYAFTDSFAVIENPPVGG
ncbi:phage major capsid family protein [Flaviflexus equikiangi]|uniref:Phage major capsid protein n=1 Tax=Flaviflexus equikiangi TaxID=2758573 RepID=A0ABS2TGD5_9ACTO|nr:phage major capsid protein [Flaviflexus equikiangi]MBM9432344.1 phage major capsid protein [Flaviflexus equikiangi]